ncbi:MAG: hypothetical protein PVI55_20760, partial [Desulfobacterales bacterium]
MAVSKGCKYLPGRQKFEPKLCSVPQRIKYLQNPLGTIKETQSYFKSLKIHVNKVNTGFVSSQFSNRSLFISKWHNSCIVLWQIW